MEASQASEAGSIPVARSTPARPRAGRFCYARLAPAAHRIGRDNRYKTRPVQASRGHTRYKTRPTRPKSPNLARFARTGRVLSRFHHQRATQGELFTAHPQRHHRHDRNNTPTQHTKPRDEILFAHAPHTAPQNETFTAPARRKQPKFTRFHHAGANFLSQHTLHTHTGATFLSTNRPKSSPNTSRTQLHNNSHAILRTSRNQQNTRKELPATSPRQWGKTPRKVARNSIE